MAVGNPKRGEFLLDFAGNPEIFRLRANELATLEERMNCGLRDLIMGRTGMRLAREITYVGLLHKNIKNWNPIDAGLKLDRHIAKGGSWADLCGPALSIIIDTMPEFKEALQKMTRDAEEDGGEEEENPTGSPTEESIGTPSSNGLVEPESSPTSSGT